MQSRIYRHHGIVVGYHGTDRETAQRVLLDGQDLSPSANPYDWLGKGIYFWENGYLRAQQFAEEKRERGAIESPFVLGAYIHLGACLDLTDVWATALLGGYYEVLADVTHREQRRLPENRPGPGGALDFRLRYLDCAVINLCLKAAAEKGEAYQTVRGVFEEGSPAFPGAAIREKSHVQLSVRDRSCILGYFRPAGYDVPLR